MKIGNNYFAPIILGFVTAWIAQCQKCKIPFLSERDNKQMFLADLPVRLAGDGSCSFLCHFHSLPADSGTCVSNLYSHLERFASALAGHFFLNKEQGTRKLNMALFHTAHRHILLTDGT